MQYQVIENVQLGAAYNFFLMDAEVDRDSLAAIAEYEYSGLPISLGVSF